MICLVSVVSASQTSLLLPPLPREWTTSDCAAGASRSPTVAATALALVQELDLEDAIQQVADRREAVDPHEALLRQAAHVYTQLIDSASIN